MELRVLGGLEVVVDGRALTLGGRKERLVLGILAINANRAVPASRLIEALWGDEPPPSAVKSLQTHVSRLRRSLAATAGALVIETQPAGYALALGTATFDLTLVERSAETARATARAGDHEKALAAFDEALSAWSGRSLGELADHPFGVAGAARLDELRLTLTEERLESMLALGRHAVVVSELEMLCADHPLRERVWGLRMIALYRSGRQAEALRAYQDLRQRLQEELGIEPGPDLVRLERAILVQDPTLESPGVEVAACLPAASARVMLVDDHPVWRDAMRRAFEIDPSIQVTSEHGDGESAVAAVLGNPPDVVLLDLHLPGLGGVAAIRQLMAQVPSVRVLVLSGSDEEDDVLDALRAGAYGYLLKTVTAQEVLDAVRRVHAGEPVFSPALAAMVLAEFRKRDRPAAEEGLGRGETAALRLLADGSTPDEAAADLGVDEEEMRTLLRSAVGKFQRAEQPAIEATS